MQRQLSILLRELHTRQRRLDALEEAARKLEVVRSLMATKGSHAAPKQMRELKDAVAPVSYTHLTLPTICSV